MVMVTTMPTKLIAEFIGTFLLVFTIGCNVLSKTPVWAAVSIACVLMVSIYALGSISGANFNPAVSLAIFVCRKMGGPGDLNAGSFGAYVAVQLAGGLVGAFSYALLFWNAFNLAPSKGFSWFSAGLCELLYTFMLCFVVLNVAVAKKNEDGNEGKNQFYGLAIGFVIIAGAYGAGAVSGGCFNPAVAVGIDTSSAGLGFGWCIPYVFFECLGAVIAAAAFKVVRPSDFVSLSAPAMESVGPRKMEKLVSEFLGTYMLVLTVGLNVLGASQAGAFSIAASLMCMIYALGDVSGAHFNPAVTFAYVFAKPDPSNIMSMGLALQYIVAQIIGGVSASWTYKAIYQGYSFPLTPQPGYTWGQAAVAETIFTFVLCYIVLCVACHPENKSKEMFGLAIGSCVTVGGFAIGSISGGSLNPAVSLGIAGCHSLRSVGRAFAYSFFEILGAGLAAGAMKMTHREK
jgi:aquaporin Z